MMTCNLSVDQCCDMVMAQGSERKTLARLSPQAMLLYRALRERKRYVSAWLLLDRTPPVSAGRTPENSASLVYLLPTHMLWPVRSVPNALTVARILATPVILVCLLQDTLFGQGAALVLFVMAAFSDFLDGHLARQMQAQSRLGRFLDPVAEKVLVLGTFLVLSVLWPILVPWWAVALIAARDVFVTLLRVHVESRGHSLQTLPIAKAKTTVQLIFLAGLLALLTANKMDGALGEVATGILGSAIPLAVLVGVVAVTAATGLLYIFKPKIIAP